MTVTADPNSDNSGDGTGTVVSENVLPLALPSALRLPDANISYTVAEVVTEQARVAVTVSLTSSTTAVYVWLSTLEQGRFSDNAFFLVPGACVLQQLACRCCTWINVFVLACAASAGVEKTVEFMSFDEAGTSAAALKASLRVEHLKMYV